MESILALCLSEDPPYDINALAVASTFAALEDAPYTQQYVERDWNEV